jgi:hypothetical protein|tara:strand:+ start:377 stop:568 length:192 start_codon:yes stop_codon:yes gene_type:complete
MSVYTTYRGYGRRTYGFGKYGREQNAGFGRKPNKATIRRLIAQQQRDDEEVAALLLLQIMRGN